MFTVVLPPWVMAMAMATAEERPENAKKQRRHQPPTHPDADLWGAMSEHAFAYHHRIHPGSITATGSDGGVDFTLGNSTLDIKSSGIHESSWVIPGKELKSDWYVFAFVKLPDRVVFKGKARRETLERLPISTAVPGKRIVRLTDVMDIGPEDFRYPQDGV